MGRPANFYLRLASAASVAVSLALCLTVAFRMALDDGAALSEVHPWRIVWRSLLIVIVCTAAAGAVGLIAWRIARRSGRTGHTAFIVTMTLPIAALVWANAMVRTWKLDDSKKRVAAALQNEREKDLQTVNDLDAKPAQAEDRARTRAALVDLAGHATGADKARLLASIAFHDLMEPALDRWTKDNEVLRSHLLEPLLQHPSINDLKDERVWARRALESLDHLIEVARSSAKEWPAAIDPPLTEQEIESVQPMMDEALARGMTLRTTHADCLRAVEAVLVFLIDHFGDWTFAQGRFSCPNPDTAAKANALWDVVNKAYQREREAQVAAKK